MTYCSGKGVFKYGLWGNVFANILIFKRFVKYHMTFVFLYKQNSMKLDIFRDFEDTYEKLYFREYFDQKLNQYA